MTQVNTNTTPGLSYRIGIDLDNLNINYHLRKIGKLFKRVNHRYSAGKPAVEYHVKYEEYDRCLKLPVKSRARRPFGNDDTQNKFSFEPLIQYHRDFNRARRILCATNASNPIFIAEYNHFLERYYCAVEYFCELPDHIRARCLCEIDLYGGLCRRDYKKLAYHLDRIRYKLIGSCFIRNLINNVNQVQSIGVLALNSTIDYLINKDSPVYNKLFVPQDKFYGSCRRYLY